MSEMKSLTLNGKTYDCFVDSVARSQVEATAVVGSASGEQIVVSDASHYDMVGLRIFGKTTQDGTPTPDAPVEMVSVGDRGNITVNMTGVTETESMTVATPNGLPGIPVDSGGNYTDANGQQWICDEIDFARGVYVQRVYTEIGTPDKIISVDNAYASTGGAVANFAIKYNNLGEDAVRVVLSDRALGVSHANRNLQSDIYRCYAPPDNKRVVCLRYPVSAGVQTSEQVIADFDGITIIYVLATPIETPLSEEQLAAYAALHTYRDHTTVSNDASAHMEIEYVMDAKKYIDSLVASGTGASARLTSVTLRAAEWEGSDSLYSQMVSVPGVTPYSKVDLLPSVEQLAIFYNKDVTFVTENDSGVVTVYAIGEKPILDYTMQAQITEVAV